MSRNLKEKIRKAGRLKTGKWRNIRKKATKESKVRKAGKKSKN